MQITPPDVSNDKVKAFLQDRVDIYSLVTADPKHSSRKAVIRKMRYEEVELRKCREVMDRVKNAIAKQKNVSMDIKNGLKEL